MPPLPSMIPPTMVETVDDIPWGEPGPERIRTARPRKCNHRGTKRIWKNISPDGVDPVHAETCGRCGHAFDPAKQKQGKSSNRIAKDIERWVGKILRLSRVGQYGGQEDLGKSGEWAFVQVKSGPSWFAERYWREIEALPVAAGRRRALVVADKPGSSGKRRAMWVEILEEVPLPGNPWVVEDGNLVCGICGGGFPAHVVGCVKS